MRILLVDAGFGGPQLLLHLPQENVCGLVAEGTRPQYYYNLRPCVKGASLTVAIQPLAIIALKYSAAGMGVYAG